MYYALFNQVTKTIEDLQKIQQMTEEMFINSDEPELILFSHENIDEET